MSIFPFKNEAITSTLENSIFLENSLPPPAVSPPSSFPFPFFHNGIQKLSPPTPSPNLKQNTIFPKKHKIEKNIWIPKAEAPFSRRGDEFRNSAIGAIFALFSYDFQSKSMIFHDFRDLHVSASPSPPSPLGRARRDASGERDVAVLGASWPLPVVPV